MSIQAESNQISRLIAYHKIGNFNKLPKIILRKDPILIDIILNFVNITLYFLQTVFRIIEEDAIDTNLVQRKTIRQFHERPQNLHKDDKLKLDDKESKTKNSELSYNDIYKQMSAPKHANDNYEHKIDFDNKLDRHSVKNSFSLSENYPRVDTLDSGERGIEMPQGK